MRNKFDTLQETSERHAQNGGDENFVTAHIEVEAKFRIPWVTMIIIEKWDNMKKAS